MATHSSIFAWKIPWTEKPGGLRSTEPQRVGHDWATKHTYIYMYLYTHTYIKRCFYYSLSYLEWLEQYLIYSRSSLNDPLDGWMDGGVKRWMNGGGAWTGGWSLPSERRWGGNQQWDSEGKMKEGGRACEITKFLYLLQHYKLSSKKVKTFLLT